MALRVLLATLLTAILLSLLAMRLGIPGPLSMYGVMISMMTSLAVNDNTPAKQKITFLIIPLVSVAALILGVIVSHISWLNITLFLILIFIAVFIRRYGPRGAAIGIIIFNTYFFAIFIQASFKILPFLILSNFIAVPAAYIIRFYVLKDNPAGRFRFLFAAYKAQVWLILYKCSRYLIQNDPSDKFKFRIRKYFDNLNNLSISIEDALDLRENSNPALQEWLNRVINLEIVTETISFSIWNMKRSGLVKEEDRSEIRRVLKESAYYSGPDFMSEESIENLCSDIKDDRFCINLNRFKWAVSKISAVRTLKIPDEIMQHLSHSENNNDNNEQNEPIGDIVEDIKVSFKSFLAAGLSVFAGKMISPNRWYWAVITAYILFTSTETVGETISKTWQRVSGTAIGIILGIGIAELITLSPKTELVIIFLLIFLAFYLIQVSYAGMIICFTALLALLYKLLGQFHEQIMYIRLEETLAGGLAGALVALTVFPSKTSNKLNKALSDVMDMITDLMKRRAEDKTLSGSRIVLLTNLKDVERKLQILRTAHTSTKINILPFVTINKNRIGHAISVFVFAFKHYLITATERESDADFREAVFTIESNLVSNIKSASEVLNNSNQKISLFPVREILQELNITKHDPNYSRKLLKIQWLELMDSQINYIASEIE